MFLNYDYWMIQFESLSDPKRKFAIVELRIVTYDCLAFNMLYGQTRARDSPIRDSFTNFFQIQKVTGFSIILVVLYLYVSSNIIKQ